MLLQKSPSENLFSSFQTTFWQIEDGLLTFRAVTAD